MTDSSSTGSASRGSDWSDEELDLIVAEYFGMLTPEPDAVRGWKAARIRRLDEQIGRGEGSIGRKLSNITFVASRLALPPLQGFGALPNIQRAIYPAVERYLRAHPAVLSDDAFLHPEGRTMPGFTQPSAPFRSPWAKQIELPVGNLPSFMLPTDPVPPLEEERKARPEGLTRLVRKFDPATRDNRNRILGRLGEERVLNHEINRLITAERMDLAKRVEWTSDVHGDGAGYDIRSFEADGSDRLIEVKATKGGATTDFFLTRTEKEVSMERPDAWRLYRLHTLAAKPRLFVLAPPLEDSVRLSAEAWRASF
jgi:hypothetical protein